MAANRRIMKRLRSDALQCKLSRLCVLYLIICSIFVISANRVLRDDKPFPSVFFSVSTLSQKVLTALLRNVGIKGKKVGFYICNWPSMTVSVGMCRHLSIQTWKRHEALSADIGTWMQNLQAKDKTLALGAFCFVYSPFVVQVALTNPHLGFGCMQLNSVKSKKGRTQGLKCSPGTHWVSATFISFLKMYLLSYVDICL